MMNDSYPQPLAEDELARMDRELTDAVERDGELYLATDAPKDMRRLLAEVDRLRAENTAMASKLAAGRAVLTNRIAELKAEQERWRNMPTSTMDSADWLNAEFQQRRLGEVEDLLVKFDAVVIAATA